MFFELYQHQRDALIQPCFYWLKNAPEGEASEIVTEIIDVFYEWRDAQADENGLVSINQNVLAAMGGLLGFGEPIKTAKYAVTEKTPLEVAGPLVHDDIDLAFKIWGEQFPSFQALLDRRGTMKVFAVIGIYSKNAAWTASLINLNRFLTEHLIAFTEAATHFANKAFEKDRKGRQQLDSNRAKALEAKRIGAQERKRRAREAAISYFKSKPTAKVAEVAQAIAAADPSLGKSASIQKLIVGTQIEARKLLAQ